jgi:phage terminase large subunit-like protein
LLLDRGHRSLEVLEADGIPVSEFFQNAARMGPATARAYALIMNGALSHDGDPAGPGPPRRRRHPQARLAGARLAKEHKDSPRRIDACVAAVMAVHRAAEPADTTPAIYA